MSSLGFCRFNLITGSNVLVVNAFSLNNFCPCRFNRVNSVLYRLNTLALEALLNDTPLGVSNCLGKIRVDKPLLHDRNVYKLKLLDAVFNFGGAKNRHPSGSLFFVRCLRVVFNRFVVLTSGGFSKSTCFCGGNSVGFNIFRIPCSWHALVPNSNFRFRQQFAFRRFNGADTSIAQDVFKRTLNRGQFF